MCILTKDECRKIVREKLNSMSDFDRSFKSEMIIDDIITSRLLDGHSNILLYKALRTEVNVDRLIDYAYSHGKTVFLPRVCGEEMQLVKLPCELKKGAFGIFEPVGEAVLHNVDLVITPVLAVDGNNNRLGKGKGYYDRFFAKQPNAYKVAVAFREQTLKQIPTNEFDVKMDKIFVR